MFTNIKMSYNHAHSEHSNQRMLDSVCKIKPLIDTAIKKGANGICITDHESISGSVKAIQYIKELKESGKITDSFKLGLGDEIYLVDSIEEVRDNYKSGVTKFYHFIVVAKDLEGFRLLQKITSTASDNSFKTGKMERVPISKQQLFDIVSKNKGHLMASTACLGSEFSSLVKEYIQDDSRNVKMNIHRFIQYCKELFAEDFYIELQPSHYENDEQEQYNKVALKLAEAYGLKAHITTDIHYLEKEHSLTHESFLCSRDGGDAREIGDFYKTTYFMTPKEIYESVKNYISFDKFKELVENSNEFMKDIQFYDLYHPTIVPEVIKYEDTSVRHLFSDWYDRCEYIQKFATSESEQDRVYLQKCEDGFIRIKQEFTDVNINRIDAELKELWLISKKMDQHVSAYYNLTDFIINECIYENGLLGIGRGSMASWYTLYLIGLHAVNPIEFGLPLWRHLSSERPEMPDCDLDSSARNRPKIVEVMKRKIGDRRVINMCAFKTETPKSCVQVVCRGLEIPTEDGQYLASLIPVDRGEQYSFKECFEGSEEKEREPVVAFINEIERLIDEYNKPIKEMLFLLEGIISAKTIHASALLVTEEDYTERYASMRAPNGTIVTAFEAHDIEYMGGLKEDMLTIECLDKIEVCMELLMRDKYMDWQGDWKSTFLKYIHPDVLHLNNDDIWENICNGKIMNLFQFETVIGYDCITRLKPHNLYDMGVCNSIMRIISDGELPIDRYDKFKGNISLWYEEMRDNGLNTEEIALMEKHLSKVYGVTTSQEEIMLLSMDEKIAGFNLTMANKLRKACAKRNPKVQEEIKKEFFDWGARLNNRKEILLYVWEYCIRPLMKYAFSLPHVYSYSLNGFVEGELYTLYPSIYWDCACLTVNAQAVEEDEEDQVEDLVEGEAIETKEKKKNKTTKYDKIAKALGDVKNRGIKVSPPYVSKAKFSFEPNLKNNEIVYSLKAVNGVSDETAKTIVVNQPYSSLEEFMEKVLPKKTEMIALIKCGALDEFNSNRVDMMSKYVKSVVGERKSLNGQNMDSVINRNLVPKHLDIHKRYHKYKKYIFNNKFKHSVVEESKSNKNPRWWYVLDEISERFFCEHFISICTEDKHYSYSDDGKILVDNKKFADIIKQTMSPLYNYLNSEELISAFNKSIFDEEWNKYCSGNTSKWEMESMVSYLTTPHELSCVDTESYSIKNFSDLSEDPVIEGYYKRKGADVAMFQLNRIVGTVIAKNKTRHTVTLLCANGDVVDVKLYAGAFSAYDKQISNGEEGKEKSWFSRGNKIMVYGYRQGSQFRPKKYKGSPVQHTVSLIVNIIEGNGVIVTKDER